jgi:hypothetical protein
VIWRHHVILAKLFEAQTVREASLAAGVHRQTFWRWLKASPEFAEAVSAARQTGKEKRTFCLWLRHPFRGRRPPTGKGHGEKPRFSYVRR